ncbi:hypothetical protein GCM10010483_46060 [Actinokineospora diospyrosa]
MREFVERPLVKGRPSTRRSPIVVFAGPKGSGKTGLLDAVRAELEGNVPYARIDCGELLDAVPWEVLSFLTFEFNRTAAGYGTIPFPRFVTAQAAIAEPLTLTNLAADRTSIRRALERLRHIDVLRAFLQDQVGQVAAGLSGVPEGVVRLMPDLLLRGLVRWRRGRRVVLGDGLEFYGEGDRAYDELIRLHRLTRAEAGEGDRTEAAELLWSAFLADLRAAFASHRGVRTWSLNCVVLLDNIDTESGRLLYNALADARRRDADPLTVVATSSGTVAQHIAGEDPLPTAEEAGRADYEQRATDARYADAYPIALRDLTLEEVTQLVSEVGNPMLNARRDVAESVHRFTRGHPGATALLVGATGHLRQATSPRDLLGERWRGPVGAAQITLAERMLRDFLGESPPDELVAWLELCAAAPHIDAAAVLTRFADAAPDGAAVAQELQVKDAAGRQVMLPALRNLLLYRLAQTPRRWTAVHTWLRDNGATTHRRYHALAAHDLTSVVGWFEPKLRATKAWFAELDTVVAAPCDLDGGQVNRYRLLDAVGWTDEANGSRRLIAEAVVALWLAEEYSTTARVAMRESGLKKLRELAADRRVVRGDFDEAVDRVANRARSESRGARTTRYADSPVAFVPPLPPATKRSRLRLRVVAAAVALALVAAGGLFAWDRISRCAEGVYQVDGECVGVTDGSYVFDEQLRTVQDKIFAENERVAGSPYVTLAVLTPLLPNPVGGSVTWGRIRAQLEGAHAAQVAANKDKREPKVRLLLANPGSRQQEWRAVVEQLVELADDEHLVGVVGVGQSTKNARDTAVELSRVDIPMVASVVTAARFAELSPSENGGTPGYIKGFTRVSTTTRDQVTVLAEHLAQPVVRKAMLVYDSDESDLYTSSLREEFEAAAARGKVSISVKSRFDTEASLDTQFREIMRDLCGDGAPDTVLYAGRAVLLDDLIANLRTRGCALDRTITLATGSDASMLRTRPDLRPKAGEPGLAIRYTPHVDPEAARKAGIKEFDTLTADFDRLGFDPTDLDDGWGVMMHDATLAAAESISRSMNGLAAGELPNRKSIRAELGRSDRERNAVRGAGGTFTIDGTTGNAVGRKLPIMAVEPNGTLVFLDSRSAEPNP